MIEFKNEIQCQEDELTIHEQNSNFSLNRLMK